MEKGRDRQAAYAYFHEGCSIFSLAGLYDTWTDPEENKLSTCTIITTEPNFLMEDIHNRMPVILRPKDESEWLGRDNDDVQSLLSLLKPYEAAMMRAHEVPKEVGNVLNNNEKLIKEVGSTERAERQAEWIKAEKAKANMAFPDWAKTAYEHYRDYTADETGSYEFWRLLVINYRKEEGIKVQGAEK